MTKAEIVEKVSAEIKVSKAATARALAIITGSITDAIRKGGKVALIGFGTFSVAARKARKGRNPQTGKEIKIAAKKVPKFSAGAALKVAASGKAVAAKAKKSNSETEDKEGCSEIKKEIKKHRAGLWLALFIIVYHYRIEQ